MVEISELRFLPAEYRVRLFLSVDLSGSTAFKNSNSGENRQDSAAPKWVTVFQQFYSDFPALFRSEFQRQKNQSVGQDGCPKLWKAVGDELVFCGRITNKKACLVALTAFVTTLHNYRKKLIDEGIELNLKGAGWLAAFPEPNRTVQLRRRDDMPDLLSASEALEYSADEAPFDFDFLGKAIDTGFRVAANAKPERFVLSVQLARLVASCAQELGFGHPIRLDRPIVLKGVNKNEPYPVLYLDTMVHLPNEKARIIEREVLQDSPTPIPQRLLDYLAAYCSVVGTDEVMLRKDSASDPVEEPQSYADHKSLIAEHLQSEQGREFDGDSDHENGIEEYSEEQGESILQTDELVPLPDESGLEPDSEDP